jgi:hypothetical protein
MTCGAASRDTEASWSRTVIPGTQPAGRWADNWAEGLRRFGRAPIRCGTPRWATADFRSRGAPRRRCPVHQKNPHDGGGQDTRVCGWPSSSLPTADSSPNRRLQPSLIRLPAVARAIPAGDPAGSVGFQRARRVWRRGSAGDGRISRLWLLRNRHACPPTVKAPRQGWRRQLPLADWWRPRRRIPVDAARPSMAFTARSAPLC